MSDGTFPEVDIRNCLSMMFSSPFMCYEWPDSETLNQELIELVLETERLDDAGRGIRSNAGGWQSRGNIINRPEPCIKKLKKRVETMVFTLLGEIMRKDGTERNFTLLIDSWANVCRNRNYNVVHTHPNAMWTVVYYVTPGEPDPSEPYSGNLEVLDPRESADYLQVKDTVLGARTLVENKPGRMILFPSWAKHMVHPFIGSGVRISIANNVNVVEDVATTRPKDLTPATSTGTLPSN